MRHAREDMTMQRYRVKVISKSNVILHDTVKAYASRNAVTLHARLVRNMERKYFGQWRLIHVSLSM